MTRNGSWLLVLFVSIASAYGQTHPCPPQAPTCSLPSDGTPTPHVVPGCVNSPTLPCPAGDWVYDGHNLPEKVLSFTYDDGPTRPSAEATLELAQYLRSEGIRATFFINTGPQTGLWPFYDWDAPCPGNMLWGQGSNPDTPDLSVLAKIEQLGHRIANHGHNHAPLDARYGASEIQDQVCTAQGLLDPYVPDGIFLLRPPYGGWETVTFEQLSTAASLNKITGPVHWRYSSDDWMCANHEPGFPTTPEVCTEKLLSYLGTPGGVVLFHDRLLNDGPSGTCPPNYQGTWSLRYAKALVPELRNRRYLILPVEADPAFPGGMLFGNKTPWSSNYYGDGGGWGTNIGYYGTFRAGDIDGDGDADLCARGCCSMVCSLSNGTQFGSPATWQALFSNANGWLPPERSTTIQLGDVNNDGKDDLCALEIDGTLPDGVICAISNGSTFGTPQYWLAASSLPAEIDDDPGYYRTIRLAKVVPGNKGKDFCFRGKDGMICAVNNGSGFDTPTNWSTTFADASGWKPSYYSGTTQFGDIDGDGDADVCARGLAGIYCGLSNPATKKFDDVKVWSLGKNFSNSDFLPLDSSTKYTATLRLADVDGDKRADACIRSSAGFLCAQSTGSQFDVYRVWQKNHYRDSQGWEPDQYAATVMLADATGDGRADVCVRGPDGVVCSPSEWCLSCSKTTGSLAGTGAVHLEPEYDAADGIHLAAMAGPTGMDFNLELEKLIGAAWTTVVVSPGPTSPERITYRGTAGKYRWKISSANGAGPYTLWLNHP